MRQDCGESGQHYGSGRPRIRLNSKGQFPNPGPAPSSNPRISTIQFVGWKVACALLVLGLVRAVTASAQTFTTLVNFDGTDGSYPYSTVIQGPDGNLYGTSYAGGANGSGEVLQMGFTGVLNTLYSFCSRQACDDGAAPAVGLALGTDEDFYGTTAESGAYLSGTLFKITSGGKLTSLHDFCTPPHCTDGAYPHGALVLSGDGNFYGTTSAGGRFSAGTVFSITSSGNLTVVYAFCAKGACADGNGPQAGLTLGTDGLFYGTTYNGGSANSCQSGCGTVFKVTPQGSLTTLYSFCAQAKCTDGYGPLSELVEGRDGNFYGTTARGGAHSQGTVFKITPGGALTTLYSFCSETNCADGSDPRAGLSLANDGAFYGTTYSGGAYSNGAVFRISTSGRYTVLHSFDVFDGQNPASGLFQSPNGTFYGTTVFGGSSRAGTAFSLNMGLPAFVQPVPVGGKQGRSVIVLGTDLTGSTSVTFNGVSAAYTIESGTAIKATVPSGASTGPVRVVTPAGTLTSDVSFRVEQ